jgi:DNA-binding transcriptional ArsR family regulator
VDKIFKALADPTRRALLDRLFNRQGQTLSELCEGTGMRRQSVTKHLNLLEEAELIVIRWQGREKQHFLNPVPIAQVGRRWIDKFSSRKAAAILNLKEALEDRQEEDD